MQEHKAFFLVLAILFAFDAFLFVKVFAGDEVLDSEVYFFDVGQGDSSLIVTESGARILIDGGKEGSRLLTELDKVLVSDRYIDLLVMSHGDFDHYGGFLDVLDRYEIGAFIGTGRKEEKSSYEALLKALENKGIGYVSLMEGDSISFEEEKISVLSPSDGEILSADLNDGSLVFLFDGNEFDVFYTGDAGTATEQRLAREYDLRTDVLKVGHHGSKTSSDVGFLQELLPLASVISVGQNSYGHPHGEVLDSLSSVSDVFRTDEEGSIKISSWAGELLVEKVE